MVEQTLTLAELQEGSLEQILQNVAKANAIVTVLLPDGAEVGGWKNWRYCLQIFPNNIIKLVERDTVQID